MGLGNVIEAAERSERTLTVFNPTDEQVTESLADALRDRNVIVTAETTASGRPTEFVVLDLNGVVLAAMELTPLRSLLDDAKPAAGGLGFETDGYAELLQYLQKAAFTSVDRDRMLQATREIEDRAFRVGTGRLVAGFQTTARLETERDRYVELADRGIDVTAYAAPGIRSHRSPVQPSACRQPRKSLVTGSLASTVVMTTTSRVHSSPKSAPTGSTASGRTIPSTSTGFTLRSQTGTIHNDTSPDGTVACHVRRSIVLGVESISPPLYSVARVPWTLRNLTLGRSRTISCSSRYHWMRPSILVLAGSARSALSVEEATAFIIPCHKIVVGISGINV